MAWSRRSHTFPVMALLMLALGIRWCGAYQKAQQKRDDARAAEELWQRLESPGTERTVMRPAETTPTPVPSRGGTPSATPESHEGWVVEAMTAWCENGLWAGEAGVHATTETPATWGFVFTLTDGTRDVGVLRGQDDRMAYMDPHPLRLTSQDPCREGTFAYRWTVVP